MLNGKELFDKKIISNVPVENIAQHGIDLNVIEIEEIIGEGFIPYQGKSLLPEYKKIDPVNNLWLLKPGIYQVKFSQGCEVPCDQMLLIRQRSSLSRCGAWLHSSVFDAGFKTKNIGTVIAVFNSITIEYNARIAQIYNHLADEVENLYDGQFQHDKQRK